MTKEQLKSENWTEITSLNDLPPIEDRNKLFSVYDANTGYLFRRKKSAKLLSNMWLAGEATHWKK